MSTLTFNYWMFFYSLWVVFVILILDLEVERETEHNLAILKETFSLPGSQEWCHVWKSAQNGANMLFQNIFFFSNMIYICWIDLVAGLYAQIWFWQWPVHSSHFTKSTVSPNIVNIPTHLIRLLFLLLCFGYSGTALHHYDHRIQAIYKRGLLWRREHHVPRETRHHHPRHAGGCHHYLHRHHCEFYSVNLPSLLAGSFITSHLSEAEIMESLHFTH